MLTTLRIRNLALVADLTLEFPGGLVVVTGETGAGKSIILGALKLLLGERAERTQIRAGDESCTVEAAFEVGRLPTDFRDLFEGQGLEPCANGQLLLKRTFTAAGANRQFVNGSPTTLAVLAGIGDWLVDMHGPHEHQSLLHPARQLAILDAFGGLQTPVAAFGDGVRERASVQARKVSLMLEDRDFAQQVDLLRFQVNEIATAQLRPAEDAELEREHQRAGHAARLLELGQAALEQLGGDEVSVLSQAGAVGRLLLELQRVDADAGSLTAAHEQMVNTARELQGELGRYLDRIETDPERLQQLEERLNLLQSLKRKYGSSVEAVLAFGEEAKRRLGTLESRDAEAQRLNAELARLDAELLERGRKLTAARGEVAPRLAKAVAAQLSELGFRQSRFEVRLASPPAPAGGSVSVPGPAGFDTVEFEFAPNPGEPGRPLRSIASSGEMARVMLAIKTVLAVEDEIPVLVFDEVDANVGGETGRVVGEKLREIARQRQVFCVTHLPQVAAAADVHFRVTKDLREGRTITQMERLDGSERVTELTRMLGGQSAAARKHAQSLLSELAPRTSASHG